MASIYIKYRCSVTGIEVVSVVVFSVVSVAVLFFEDTGKVETSTGNEGGREG